MIISRNDNKVVFTGIESSGKSLLLAKVGRELVIRNSKWFYVTGIVRPIRSNLRFSPEFEEFARAKNVPIFYWTNLEEVIYETECDVIMDELLKYFDARLWVNLTLDAKHWLTQGAKTGVRVYATSQDFSQVEKQFRLLCNRVFVVKKLIGSPRPMKTAPPVKHIWGLCSIREVIPSTFTGDNVSMESKDFFPDFFFIRQEDTSIFNTNAKVVPSELPVKRMRQQRVQFIERDGVTVAKETLKWV